MPVLVVQFSIDCDSGPNCTDSKEVILVRFFLLLLVLLGTWLLQMFGPPLSLIVSIALCTHACTHARQANAYEEPDPEWYTNPDTMQQYFRHYPIGTEHTCYYEKKQYARTHAHTHTRTLHLFTLTFTFVSLIRALVGWC
jgi:hypothetical protein